MKATHKKVIAYAIFFAYMAMCSSILFLGPDIKIANDFLFYSISILIFPGLFISFVFGFFCGTKWAILGAILTILIMVYIIERIFKRPNSHRISKNTSID